MTGILVACGFQVILRDTLSAKRLKNVTFAATGIFGFFMLWYFGALMGVNDHIASLGKEGWGTASDTLARLRVRSMGIGTGMALLLAVFLWLRHALKLHGRRLKILSGVMLLIVGLDTLALHRTYVATLDPALIKENTIVQFLKSKSSQRVYMMDQGSFYNSWLTYLFPYHNVDAFNFTQYPRMPHDYKTYLETFAQNPFALWQYSAIGHVMGPAQVWGQVQANPSLKDSFALSYAYRVKPTGSQMAVEVEPATQQAPGTHCILQYKRPAMRYALISDWDYVPLDQPATTHGVRPTLHPWIRWLSTHPIERVWGSHPAGLGRKRSRWSHYRPAHITLKVSSDRTAILRCADKYAPGWTAKVNGKPAEVIRCDYLFRGIKVPPGLHEVKLDYRTSRSPLILQFLGMASCFIAGGMLIITSRKSPPAPNE